MSYIQTLKNKKAVTKYPYSYKPEINSDPRTSKAFVKTKCYKNWRKYWTPDNDFDVKGFNSNNDTINKGDYEKYINAEFNIGLCCGVKWGGSNIIGFDIDDYKWKDRDNHPWFKEFGGDYIELFDTYTQETPSGGRHLFFKYNERISKSVNHELEIDVKSNGGVIMMAGSHIPKKGTYKVINNTTIKEMPLELILWIEKHIYEGKDPNKNIAHAQKDKSCKIGTDKGGSLHLQTEYKYIIPKERFKTLVVDELPTKYFKNYGDWLKFITACKYLNFIDIAKEKSKKYFTKDNKIFESDFMNHWNRIYNPDYLVIEILYNEINKTSCSKKGNKCDDLYLYRYKEVPKNLRKADERIHIDKLSKILLEKQDISKNIEEGNCYVIKSDTGTGKSFLARGIIKRMKEKNINFISIVSRVGLADEQYKDIKGDKVFVKYYKNLLFQEGYNVVTTIDSILKYERVENWSKYFIFVDEINSLLKYLWTAPHIKNKPKIIELFMKILRECRGFYLADADVSDKVFDFLNYVKRGNTHFIENTYKHNNTIEVIEVNRMNEIIELIKKDKKFLLCCDSKTIAQSMYEKLKELFPDLQLYTADDKLEGNFGDAECLIISPKVIYGQDSTLDRNVYCIYDGRTIDSEAMKQQICRERKIKKVFIHFTSLKQQATKSSFRTIQDCVEKTKKQEDFITKLFGANGYDEELCNIYTDLYNKFQYHIDCLKTNLRLHLFNILRNHGFIVKPYDEMKRMNISPKERKALSIEHKTKIFTYENDEVKDWVIKYFGEEIYEDKKYVEENLLSIFINSLLGDLHNIKYYLQLYNKIKRDVEFLNKTDYKECNELDFYEEKLDLDNFPNSEEILAGKHPKIKKKLDQKLNQMLRKKQNKESNKINDPISYYEDYLKIKVGDSQSFNISRINDNILTKFYFMDVFKNDLDFRINEENNEIIINETWSDENMKEMFKEFMKNIIKKKTSKSSKGYELQKDFYCMISAILPLFYHTYQYQKREGKKTTSIQKYYYKDKEELIPIAEKMISGYDNEAIILLQAIKLI